LKYTVFNYWALEVNHSHKAHRILLCEIWRWSRLWDVHLIYFFHLRVTVLWRLNRKFEIKWLFTIFIEWDTSSLRPTIFVKLVNLFCDLEAYSEGQISHCHSMHLNCVIHCKLTLTVNHTIKVHRMAVRTLTFRVTFKVTKQIRKFHLFNASEILSYWRYIVFFLLDTHHKTTY